MHGSRAKAVPTHAPNEVAHHTDSAVAAIQVEAPGGPMPPRVVSDRSRTDADRIHEAIWPIWQRDLPETLLLPSLHMSVAHRSIRGLRSPDRVVAMSGMDQLWVEEEGDVEADAGSR